MIIVRSLIWLVLFTFTQVAYADGGFPFPIYQRVSGYGFTNTWFVAMNQIDKAAGWEEKGEPSLSVGKAVELGKAWVISKGGSTKSYVESVEFQSVDRGRPPGSSSKFRHFWFYLIRFDEVFQVGSSVTCVVLLDGSIVEPASTPHIKSVARYLD
jgi:hypothetical protein